MRIARGDDWPKETGIEKARRALNLTMADLYVRYFGLTGVAPQEMVDAYLRGLGPSLDVREHDKLVLAINECFAERGLPDRLPFAEP